MNLGEKIFWITIYLITAIMANRVAINVSKGFTIKWLRTLFVALCTISAVLFLAIVFIIITYKVDKNERW
jgi:hypothetical protein